MLYWKKKETYLVSQMVVPLLTQKFLHNVPCLSIRDIFFLVNFSRVPECAAMFSSFLIALRVRISLCAILSFRGGSCQAWVRCKPPGTNLSSNFRRLITWKSWRFLQSFLAKLVCNANACCVRTILFIKQACWAPERSTQCPQRCVWCVWVSRYHGIV